MKVLKTDTELVDWKMKRVNLTNWEKVPMRRGKREMEMEIKWIANPGNHVRHHVRAFL